MLMESLQDLSGESGHFHSTVKGALEKEPIRERHK